MTHGDQDQAKTEETKSGWFAETFSEVRKQVIVTVGAGIITGIVAALLAFWALIIQLPGVIGITPSKAVMAFELENGCPPGWDPYTKALSRTIVGSATVKELQTNAVVFASGEDLKLLTEKPFGLPGGSENHVLSLVEIPPHTHSYHNGVQSGSSTNEGVPSPQFWPSGWLPNEDRPSLSSGGLPDGKTQAFSLMQPYVALLYCIKR